MGKIKGILAQQEIENLHGPITIKKLKSIINKAISS